MKVITIILVCLTINLGKVYGDGCNNLIGTWKNQLNSNMTIVSINGNTFTGGYHTAVESTPGAARITSNVTGLIIPTESGKLIGFNVLWNRGASLTAWVGQCLECDGKEYLYTTWLLRSYQPTKKRWMTTRINQDTFSRISTEIGEQESSPPSQNVVDGQDMQGTWTSATGSSFKINELLGSGVWKGQHSFDEQLGGEVIGRFDGNQTYTAIGFIGASENKIKGWTGHIDEPRSASTAMETSWIEHSFSQTCRNPRRNVSFGMDNYTKS